MSAESGVRLKMLNHGWPVVGVVVMLVVALSAAACGQGKGSAARPSAGTQLTSEEQAQRIAPAEAKALVDQGKAVLYDVRSEDLFEERHAAGAQSLPPCRYRGAPGDHPQRQDADLLLHLTGRAR